MRKTIVYLTKDGVTTETTINGLAKKFFLSRSGAVHVIERGHYDGYEVTRSAMYVCESYLWRAVDKNKLTVTPWMKSSELARTINSCISSVWGAYMNNRLLYNQYVIQRKKVSK